MRRIGVLTSGGDGPGLNPCIRAVTRRALGYGLEVMGIERGYAGLMEGEMIQLDARAVGGIIGKGGTFLGTTRAPEFKTVQGQREALRNLNKHNIEGLVVIGGNGSLTGALALHQHGFPVVGVPATIDNDVPGTGMAVGVDTALNTVLGAIDRIRDTASSHQRAFLIEVMGRNCGYLALMGGVAGGAEMVLIPEVETTLEEVAQGLLDAYIRGKAHCIIVVAEGYKPGCQAIVDYLNERREELGFQVRLTVLGHTQRGGSPSAFDRLLATRLGAAAVAELHNGHYGQMVGIKGREVVTTPLEEVASSTIELDLDLYNLAKEMEK
ncbi:MAG: 6-phosphofructokinase [Anaerolineales bacterium]|nr:MAG: 6-phosphofructokinase [Anaerolineales bacterium]